MTVADLRKLLEEEISEFCSVHEQHQILLKSLFLFARSDKTNKTNIVIISKKDEEDEKEKIDESKYKYWLYIPTQRSPKWFDDMQEGATANMP